MPVSINYDSPLALRAFLESRGLGARKKLGQNFLVNPRARQFILDALEMKAGESVWEIGPGLGAMTAGLLERGGRITAFEIDKAFAEILEDIFQGRENFHLVQGDVLKTWPRAAAEFGAGPARPLLLGNLPYQIAAILLADFIEKDFFFRRAVVTVQKEVARRMAAKPGSPDYSALSLLCASAYTIRPLMVLKGPSFYPPPRVDSQSLVLDLRGDRDPSSWPRLLRPLVRRLFSARRKTIKNNLQSFVSSYGRADRAKKKSGDEGPGAEEGEAGKITLEALESCALSPERRAETLALEDFAALAKVLEEKLYDDHCQRG